MKFTASDGRLFTLTVERYEFPAEELGPTEDNPADDFDRGRFLIVAHQFCDGVRSWQISAPTMSTLDLERLADWLLRIEQRDFSTAGIYFRERNLEVAFDQKSDSVVVYIYSEFIPLGYGQLRELPISFPRKELDFSTAIASIQAQLAAFPGRPPLD